MYVAFILLDNSRGTLYAVVYNYDTLVFSVQYIFTCT